MVTSLAALRVVQVSVGVEHSLLLVDTGEVYACGINSDGRLGIGALPFAITPNLVQTPHRIVSIAAGADYSLVLSSPPFSYPTYDTDASVLLSFGSGANYAAGHGSSNVFTPAAISFFSGTSVESFAAGTFHSLVAGESFRSDELTS